MEPKKKKFEIPHTLAIIVAVMIIASILTYLIPAGEYDRYKNDAGVTMVDPDSFHYVDSSPVNPLTIFNYIYSGLSSASGIIFSLMLGAGGLGVVLSTGAVQAAAATALGKVKAKDTVVIAIIMGVFALLCIPINLNVFIPLAPLGLVLAASMGLDSVVGVSLIMLGGAVGFSCGAMNLSNTGTAQGIAELELFSGMWFRLVSMVPFYITAVWFVSRYAKKIKADPTKSLVYGLEGSSYSKASNETLQKKHILPLIVFLAALVIIIIMALTGKSSNQSMSAAFLYMGLLVGISARMSVNDICKEFMNGAKGMASTAMMIGFAYGISGILNAGKVMDTVVYALSGVLNIFPAIMKAPAMFILHILINCFITSGSGQAAVTMPIFVPVADLVGITRQTAVLAFNFGDGFCNNILPHAAATMGFVGAAAIPFTRWFKYVIKLFAIWVVVGAALLMIATVIGYT